MWNLSCTVRCLQIISAHCKVARHLALSLSFSLLIMWHQLTLSCTHKAQQQQQPSLKQLAANYTPCSHLCWAALSVNIPLCTVTVRSQVGQVQVAVTVGFVNICQKFLLNFWACCRAATTTTATTPQDAAQLELNFKAIAGGFHAALLLRCVGSISSSFFSTRLASPQLGFVNGQEIRFRLLLSINQGLLQLALWEQQSGFL